jgi:methionine synthase II (cobalamin-independent)
MPEAMEFPIDFLGIDLYSTNHNELKKYKFEKGISLGLVDSRSSLIEEPRQLVTRAIEIFKLTHKSTIPKIYICPNCDLEFLPWKRAIEKIKVVGTVTKLLRKEIIE